MKTYLALLLLLAVPVCRAEDWKVQGKTYSNVTVTKVEPDAVHIMYDGGIGSLKLADLPPDLQKRFNYDPKAAQEAAQAKATAQAQADAELQQELRLDSIKVQYAADIEKVSKNPLKLYGTVKDTGNGFYIVSAGGKQGADIPHHNSITGTTTYTSSPVDPTPMVLYGRGGMCMLISNQPFTVDQQINLPAVYSAGFTYSKGVFYMRYADDPALAFQLSNRIK